MIITYIEDGESKQREATVAEVEYIQSAQAEVQAAKTIEEAEIAEKASAKAAVLAKLGLTADELAALL